VSKNLLKQNLNFEILMQRKFKRRGIIF